MNSSLKLQQTAVARALRRAKHPYLEGSVTRIRKGSATGLKWRRYHRYVNAYWKGTYEPSVVEFVAHRLEAADTFWDVGANAGFFTVLAAKRVGPEGRVVAFEPLPQNASTIREQISVNAFTNCEVVEAGVADQTGHERLLIADPAMNRLDATGDLVVPTVTLDEQNGMPSLIKIDVEGAEDRVLAGATRVLSSVRPALLIETHGDSVATETLAELGYEIKALTDRHIVAIP